MRAARSVHSLARHVRQLTLPSHHAGAPAAVACHAQPVTVAAIPAHYTCRHTSSLLSHRIHSSPSTPCRSFHSSPSLHVAPGDPVSKEGDPSKTVLTLHHVSKRFESGGGKGRTLFKDVNLSFFHGAKIGILGGNGSGKSSFLKILAGVDRDISGEARFYPGFRTGYLAQEPELDESKTVSENIAEGIGYRMDLLKRFDEITKGFEAEDADYEKLAEEQAEVQAEIEKYNCWDLQYKIDAAMEALNCPPGDSPVTNLSGGERRRVALCKLLLSEPDMLLLDEPTNHLDADSVSWLEQFLSNYNGLVVAITHDRYFLDKIAGWILEIDQGAMYPFKGNYAQWLENKSKRMEMRRRNAAALDKQIEKELQWMRQPSRGRQSKGKARMKQYEKLLAEKRERLSNRAKEGIGQGTLLIPEGPRLSEDALRISDLTFSVSRSQDEDEKDPSKRSILFENLNLTIRRGDMIGVIGANGTGKSSLIRCIVGERTPDSGEIWISRNVVFGYNSQSRAGLNDEKQVWSEIVGNDEFIQITPEFSMLSRAYVAQFNFNGQDQQKLIKSLSGGERNRVSLAKSLKVGCNFIILDEPTNDLDVDTLRALEQSLQEFDGAGVIVSHDRWFLDRVCTHILAFEEGGNIIFNEGNYSDYEHDRKQREKAAGGDNKKKKKFKNIKIDT